jgi:hypothetical protein
MVVDISKPHNIRYSLAGFPYIITGDGSYNIVKNNLISHIITFTDGSCNIQFTYPVQITLTMVGGGGGGARGAYNNSTQGGGGGGGGCTIYKCPLNVASTTYTVSIGKGGIGGMIGNNFGMPGLESSFKCFDINNGGVDVSLSLIMPGGSGGTLSLDDNGLGGSGGNNPILNTNVNLNSGLNILPYIFYGCSGGTSGGGDTDASDGYRNDTPYGGGGGGGGNGGNSNIDGTNVPTTGKGGNGSYDSGGSGGNGSGNYGGGGGGSGRLIKIGDNGVDLIYIANNGFDASYNESIPNNKANEKGGNGGNGMANTGGGGGGGGSGYNNKYSRSVGIGGNGGSGVVIMTIVPVFL